MDALGNPLLFQLTGGHVHDSQPACDMFDQLPIEGSNVLGDKAYGAQAIRDKLTNKGASHHAQTLRNLGLWIGIFTRNAMWSSAFSIKSNIFAEWQRVMTN